MPFRLPSLPPALPTKNLPTSVRKMQFLSVLTILAATIPLVHADLVPPLHPTPLPPPANLRM